jgi:hAT family C-terminal dimerisation region
MLMKGRKTPLQYWQSDGVGWPDLSKICLKLFTMATSSAASERNFSTTGFIHSKLRNCLAPASVQKLVYIKSNYLAISESLNESDGDSSTESSSVNQDD